MTRASSGLSTLIPAQAMVLGILTLFLLAQPISSAPFSTTLASLESVSSPPSPLGGGSGSYLKEQLQNLYHHLDQGTSIPSLSNDGHRSSLATLNFQSNVHPLNRRKAENRIVLPRMEKKALEKPASMDENSDPAEELRKRQVQGGFQPNQFSPVAQDPAQEGGDPDSDPTSGQTISVAMPGRIGAALSTQNFAVATSIPATVVNPVSSSQSQPLVQSQSPIRVQSQSSANLKTIPSASASTPASTTSRSPSSTTTSSSVSKSPTSTTTTTKAQDRNDSPSLFSPKNHLYHLIIIAIIGALLFSFFLLISIARACAHWRMRSDGGDKGNLTRGARVGTVKTGRSLRRAITVRRLGSFQRRNREGSVLIEVGDEVFAVPLHIAEEFHRRQKQASDPSANSSVLGRAGDSRGLDLQSWRLASANVPMDGPKRSLSARLMESLRALRGSSSSIDSEDALDDEKTCYSFDSEKQLKGQMRQSNPNGFLPVMTKGDGSWNISSSDEDSSRDHHHHQHQKNSRDDFVPGPRETPQLGRPYLPSTPTPETPQILSHERIQLSDEPRVTAESDPKVPDSFPGQGRALQEVRKEESRKVNRPNARRNGNAVGGGSYKYKRSTDSDNLISRSHSMSIPTILESRNSRKSNSKMINSTQNSSPSLYMARTQTPPSPRAALQPEKAKPTASSGMEEDEGRRTPQRFRGQERQGGQGRARKVSRAPTFRPALPMPPPMSPFHQSEPRLN